MVISDMTPRVSVFLKGFIARYSSLLITLSENTLELFKRYSPDVRRLEKASIVSVQTVRNQFQSQAQP